MESKSPQYHKPALEASLTQKIQSIEQRIPIVAVAYAEKRQPSLTDEDMGAYFKEFHEEYQGAIYMLNDGIQTNNLEVNRKKENEQSEKEISDLQNQLTIAQEQDLRKGGDYADTRKPPFPPVRLYLAWAGVAVLSLFEGLLNRQSFSAFGYNLLEASVMSIAFAALLMIIAHTFERIVKKGRTTRQQKAIAMSLLAIVMIVFWFLADVRAQYLSALVAESTGKPTSFSPIPFTLLSILLFIASVAICHFILPTREQRAAMRDYQEQCKEDRQRVDKVTQLKAAIAAKIAANDEMNRMHNSLQEYGAMLEQKIISDAKRGLEQWKKHNNLHRTDGRPKSFDKDYPFQFQTFFHHVNLM